MYNIPIKIEINEENKKYMEYLIRLLKDYKFIDQQSEEYLNGQYECIKFLEEMGVK